MIFSPKSLFFLLEIYFPFDLELKINNPALKGDGCAVIEFRIRIQILDLIVSVRGSGLRLQRETEKF